MSSMENDNPKSTSISHYIDHTVLKPTCLDSDIIQLCNEVILYSFKAICIPPNYLTFAKNHLRSCNDLKSTQAILIATVIGFPFGYACTDSKLSEINQAIENGVDELDIVANISDIKNHRWIEIETEIITLLNPIRKLNKTVKVIIESGVLTNDEIIKCCEIYGKVQIDYLKTSTGYAESGASVEAVKLFRKYLPATVQIKASGGIRDYLTAMKMIEAGATRIGCSAGVKIFHEEVEYLKGTHKVGSISDESSGY